MSLACYGSFGYLSSQPSGSLSSRGIEGEERLLEAFLSQISSASDLKDLLMMLWDGQSLESLLDNFTSGSEETEDEEGVEEVISALTSPLIDSIDAKGLSLLLSTPCPLVPLAVQRLHRGNNM
eukprot:scaffold5186_cov179-Ochromonas_danica.AAC.2